MRERFIAPGEPDLAPTGCRFAVRCPHVQPRCRETTQTLEATGAGHLVACCRVHELTSPDFTTGVADRRT